jgi:hypothetical protein
MEVEFDVGKEGLDIWPQAVMAVTFVPGSTRFQPLFPAQFLELGFWCLFFAKEGRTGSSRPRPTFSFLFPGFFPSVVEQMVICCWWFHFGFCQFHLRSAHQEWTVVAHAVVDVNQRWSRNTLLLLSRILTKRYPE